MDYFMISVHREKIDDTNNEYLEQVIFGVKKRNLQFLFVN